jgi:hypothetical protein
VTGDCFCFCSFPAVISKPLVDVFGAYGKTVAEQRRTCLDENLGSLAVHFSADLRTTGGFRVLRMRARHIFEEPVGELSGARRDLGFGLRWLLRLV